MSLIPHYKPEARIEIVRVIYGARDYASIFDEDNSLKL